MEIPFNPEIIFQYGAIGFVLGWFMFRVDKKLENINESIIQLIETVMKK
jgi:hypothetical protein